MEEEAKARMRELLLARDGGVAATTEASIALSKRSVELQEFRLVVGRVCAPLLPLPLIKVPLVDRLRALPGHVERVDAEGMFHWSNVALGQMVSHFDEIDVVVIAEGFAIDWSDKELDAIEDQDHPQA